MKNKKILGLLVAVIVLLICSTTNVYADTIVRHITEEFDINNLFVNTCPNDLKVSLIVDGNDVTSSYSNTGFYANESCTKLLLPEDGIYHYAGYNPVLAWYDNPEFTGDPISIIDYSPSNPTNITFYGKTGNTISIKYDDNTINNLVVGKRYSAVALGSGINYKTGTIDNTSSTLYNNYPDNFVKGLEDFVSNTIMYKEIESDYVEFTDHSGLYSIVKDGSCATMGYNTFCNVNVGSSNIRITNGSNVPKYYEIEDIIDSFGNSYGKYLTIDESYNGKKFYSVLSGEEYCKDIDISSNAAIQVNIKMLSSNSTYNGLISIDRVEIPGLNPNYYRFDINGNLLGYNSCIQDNVYMNVKYNIDPSLIEENNATILFEDGSSETVLKGSNYTLPSSIPTKASEVTTVTFKYQDGVTSNTTSPYTTTYTPYRFVINNINYQPGQSLIVNEDIFVYYKYLENITGNPLPTPTRSGYTFSGWYTSSAGGTRVSSIEEAVKAKTLYAQWTETNEVIITRPDGISIIVEKGSTYTIPDIPVKSTSIVSRVLFNTKDNSDSKIISYVTKSYTKNGVTINDTHYDVGQTITVNDNIVITPNYVETIIGATFPANPTKTGSTFNGWFTSESGGTEYTSYDGNDDLILYGQYDLISYSLSFAIDASTDYPYEIDYSTATYSKNNIHYGDTFTTPAITEYSQEGWCYINCESTNIDTYSDLNWYLSSKNTWKPKVRLHYMDENDTVTEYTDNVLWIDARKNGFLVNYYDSENNQTVRDELDFGTTYTFNYNQNLQEKWTNHTSGNIKSRLVPNGSVLNIPNAAEPGRNGNPIPEGYEFVGWYTAPTGGTLFNVEDTRNQFITLEQSQYIFENGVNQNFELIGGIKDFTGFEAPDYYARYTIKQYAVTTPNGVEVYDYGDNYIIPENNVTKPSENGASITFIYDNNRLPSEIRYVQKVYTPNGWLVNGVHYDDSSSITINDDITLVPDYIISYQSPEFPETIDNDYYRSEWRTASYCGGGSLVTSYNGNTDVIYYESYKRVLHFDEDNGTPIYTKTFCEYDSYMCSDALGYADKDGSYFNGWTLYINDEEITSYDASQFEASGGPGSELYFDAYYLFNYDGYALVKADYSLQSYYISYNLNGGSVSGNPRYYTIEDEITLINPTKNGYTFIGWSGTGLTGNNNMIVTIPVGSTGSRSYTANFKKNITVTESDGTVHDYLEGDSYTLDTNNDNKSDTIDSTVTFKYNNGNPDTISDVVRKYTPNGWKVNGVHYDNNSIITLTDNVIIEKDYIETVIPAEFPSNPTRENYTFDGWFNGDDEYTSYSELEDITLTAKWTGNTIIETDPEGGEIPHNYGDEITLPTNDIAKANTEEATVTFEYGNGNDNTTSTVEKSYTPNGWLINGVHYDDGASYEITENYTRVPDYIETVVPAEFPSDPTRENYTFEGWFNGDDEYTSYSELIDITLTAKWTGNTITEIDPEGGEIPHNYGDEITLPTNDIAKANTEEATVTFEYGNGNDNTTSTVEKSYTPNGWLINGVHYDDGASYEITEDYTRTPDYIETVIPAEFPSNPTRDNYSFDGWFNGEDEYTSYSELEDITLTAKWTGNSIQVCFGNNCQNIEYGTDFDLGENNKNKDDTIVSVVRYAYHFDDGSDDPYEYVMKQYTPNGWLVNGVHYDDNVSITITEEVTIEPDYTETVVPVIFFEEVTRPGYTFNGWYTEETGGEKLTSYDGEEDITVHAHWTLDLPTDFSIDSENITIFVGETKLVEVTFTPEGTEDTITYTGYDQEKISIVDGLITGLEKGETTITVGTENTDITKEITVTVNSDKLESDIYEVREKEDNDTIIIGAEPEETIGEFKNKLLNPNEYIKIYDKDDNLLSDEDTVKTGLKIKLEYNNLVLDEAVMVVRGDVDGDGFINISDYILVANHALETEYIDDYVMFTAADVEEDEILNIADYIKIMDYALENTDSLNN